MREARLPVLGRSDRFQARYRLGFRFDVSDVTVVAELGASDLTLGVIVQGHSAGGGCHVDHVQAGHQQVLRLVDVVRRKSGWSTLVGHGRRRRLRRVVLDFERGWLRDLLLVQLQFGAVG